MEEFLDGSSGGSVLDENRSKRLRQGSSECELRQGNVDLGRESPSGNMMEDERCRESLKKQSDDLERKRRRKGKLALGEEEMKFQRGDFFNDAGSKGEEFDLQLVSVHEWLQDVRSQVKGIRRRVKRKLKNVESQERSIKSAQELLEERERKVDEVIGALDERIRIVEEREEQFNVLLEGKMRELASKEEKLCMKWEEFVKEVRLADERYREQEKLRHGCIEILGLAKTRLEAVMAMINDQFKETENVAGESVEGTVKRGHLIMESTEKQVNEAKLRIKQLAAEKEFGHQLLEMLDLAKNNIEELKTSVDERFKKMGLERCELNFISDWAARKTDEVDSKAKELEKREKRVKIMENNMISIENELQKKEKDLHMKRRHLHNWEKELIVHQREVVSEQELNEKRMEELDWKEKNLNSVKDFTRSCFREHRALKKQLQFERGAVEKQASKLKDKEHRLEELARDFEFKEKQLKDRIKELELNREQLSDVLAYVKMDSDESVDIKFVVKMDGKALQMFLNDPAKDLESMGNEIFKVLHLSPDPAKLVLDAMAGFYPPHLRKGDVQCKVRETCIHLLEQLSKMSLEIRSTVREEAIELAKEWKSKMRANAQNPLEVLGFLHLLDAYNLVPYFDKDDISRFLVVVGKHRQAPELRHVLGFAEKWE